MTSLPATNPKEPNGAPVCTLVYNNLIYRSLSDLMRILVGVAATHKWQQKSYSAIYTQSCRARPISIIVVFFPSVVA